MSYSKNIMLWVLALVIMLGVYLYQKATGPTYPLKGQIELAGQSIKYKLPRSHPHDSGPFIISVPNIEGVTGKIEYRRYQSYDPISYKDMEVKDDQLMVELDHLPQAGKYMYKVILKNGNIEKSISNDYIMIRFRGGVPDFILIPHIFFMFFAMWITMRAGIDAIFNTGKEYQMAFITTISFFIGGFIFGPIMQKYAFGEYWTGWPFGHDMTDNKVLAALVVWILTLIIGKIKPNFTKILVLTAVIVQVAIYLIPHSTLGSELDFRPLQEQANEQFDVQNDKLNDLVK